MELTQLKNFKVEIIIGIILISLIAFQLFSETSTQSEKSSNNDSSNNHFYNQNIIDSKGLPIIFGNVSTNTLCSSNCDYTW